MPATVQSIVEQTIIELSQVPGASTQIYATPRVLLAVQDTFDMVFQQSWWDAYTSFWTGTLDGITGHLTADIIPTTPNALVPISSHTNIRHVWPAGSNKQVSLLPPSINPSVLTSSNSGTPIYRNVDYTFPNRPIVFYPITASGGVVLEVRQEPLHPFALTDTIYLDTYLIVLGAAYMYASDDGTNPGQINKFQSLFMKRLTDMVGAENETPLQLDPRFTADSNQWWEVK